MNVPVIDAPLFHSGSHSIVTSTATSTADDGLLEGFTVIDFTRVLAGPYCTRMLADLGARVIKIERPGEGDEIRYTILQLDPNRIDQSSYSARLNSGKEGIAINLSHPEARYFGVGRIGKDQVDDYADRKGWSIQEAERWLAPNLGYTPEDES